MSTIALRFPCPHPRTKPLTDKLVTSKSQIDIEPRPPTKTQTNTATKSKHAYSPSYLIPAHAIHI
jgi:hypothetical protein